MKERYITQNFVTLGEAQEWMNENAESGYRLTQYFVARDTETGICWHFVIMSVPWHFGVMEDQSE